MLTRVDVGNISNKGKIMKGTFTWSIFSRWFLNEICLFMNVLWFEKPYDPIKNVGDDFIILSGTFVNKASKPTIPFSLILILPSKYRFGSGGWRWKGGLKREQTLQASTIKEWLRYLILFWYWCYSLTIEHLDSLKVRL